MSMSKYIFSHEKQKLVPSREEEWLSLPTNESYFVIIYVYYTFPTFDIFSLDSREVLMIMV